MLLVERLLATAGKLDVLGGSILLASAFFAGTGPCAASPLAAVRPRERAHNPKESAPTIPHKIGAEAGREDLLRQLRRSPASPASGSCPETTLGLDLPTLRWPMAARGLWRGQQNTDPAIAENSCDQLQKSPVRAYPSGEHLAK